MRRSLLLVARFALAGVFVWAAVAKLREPWALFAMTLDSMHIVPEAWVGVVARTLPWAELFLGALLATGIAIRYVAPAATVLLSAFLAVMVVLYMRGFEGDCGCFGPGEQLGPKTLARDGALLLASGWVTFEAWNRKWLPGRV